MATTDEIRVLLTADDQASASIQRVQSSFSGLRQTVLGASEGVEHFIKVALGIYSVYEVVNQLERLFKDMGEAILGFQDKLIQVQSLRVGENLGQDFKNLSAEIADLSMTTGRSAIELGNSLFFIEGHGYKGAEALGILTQAAKLAASGLGETDQLVRVVTGQMVAYGAAASEAGHYFDVFARTEQQAALPIGELSKQMARLTPVAAALRIPIDQVGAMIATISQTGLNASRVITDLLGVLSQFIKSSPQQQEALKRIGYPIEQVRKDLIDPAVGVVETLTRIYAKAEGDVAAFGEIFSDRTRALVGFLALMRQGGDDAIVMSQKMRDAGGTVDEIFRVNQERINLQLQRSQAIWQAYGIVLTQDVLPGIANWLKTVNDLAQQGDLVGMADKLLSGLQTVATSILDVFTGLASKMFGAGENIIGELARGITETAIALISAAAEFVANLIAGFLLGSSPPPKGPLHYIEQGTAGWMKAKADAIDNNSAIVAGAAERVAGHVNDALAQIGQARGGMSLEGVKSAISDIDNQLLPLKLAADDIKDSYEAQIRPLERQISALQSIKDLEYDRQKIVFERQELELRALEIQAEGDPVKRAQLAGQLVSAQFTARTHSIQSEQARLNRELSTLRPGRGMSAQEVALRRTEIQDRLRILGIEKGIQAARDPVKLAQLAQRKELLKYEEDGAKLAHDQFLWQQKVDLQPLIEQRDKLKLQMQTELDLIKAQMDPLEDQRKILERQRQELERINAEHKKGGAGGAGGGPFKLPDTGHLQKDLEDVSNKIVGDMATTLENRMRTGLANLGDKYGPIIGQSLVGGIVGGMVLGFPGAIAGSLLVPVMTREWQAALNKALAGETLSSAFEQFKTDIVAAWSVDGLRGVFDVIATRASDAWKKAWDAAFGVTYKDEFAVSGARAWQDTGENFPRGVQQMLEANTAYGDTLKLDKPLRTPGPLRRLFEQLRGELMADDAGPAQYLQALREMLDKSLVQPTKAAILAAFAELTKWFDQQQLDLFSKPMGFGASGERAPSGPSKFGAFVQSIPDKINDELKAMKPIAVELTTLVIKWAAGAKVTLDQTFLNIASDPETVKSFQAIGESIGTAVGKQVVSSMFTAQHPELQTETNLMYGRLALALGNVNAENQRAEWKKNQAFGALGLALAGAIIDSATDAMGGKDIREQFNKAVNGLLGGTAPGEAEAGDKVKDVVAGAGKVVAGAAVLTTPFGWIFGQIYNAAKWVRENLPETTNAIGEVISGVFTKLKDTIVTPFVDWLHKAWEDLWHFVTVDVENELITVSHLFGLYMNSIKAQFMGVFGTAGEAAGGAATAGGGLVAAIVSFGSTFEATVISIGADYVWSPLFSKLDTLKAKLTDRAMAEAIRQLANLPPAGASPPPPIQGGPPTKYNATGGDWIVGGSGGTDSTRVAFWATPGERVRVTQPGNGTGDGTAVINKAGDININAPLIQGVTLEGGDMSDVDNMLDRVRDFLVNDIRAARGQGVQRPEGITARGSR